MDLLERETQLTGLQRLFATAASGRGCTALVCGEAGIGKTTLVDRFARAAEREARVLWGACEPLFTPRPLGAFHDIVHAVGGPLAVQLSNDARPIDLFHTLLEDIRRHDRPTLIVIEDAHWADHGTLDFVRFLARRIDRLAALFLLTFRDDEVGPEHPLTAVLGELPASARVRIGLAPLSRACVANLARSAGRGADEIYRVTGGNPFFVTEALHADAGALAPSVREAVLSRARHLAEPARRILDLVAVVPERVELALLASAHEAPLEPLHECLDHGLLVMDGTRVGFRHELARIAVQEAVPPLVRVALNAKMLAALAAGELYPDTLTRIAHHAIAAGDAAAIVRFIPDAATAATRRGSHREALALLTAAHPHAERMAPAERARFYEQRSRACFLVEAGAEAVRMSEAAYRLWSEQGDDHAKGRNLVRRAELCWIFRLTPPAEEQRIAREMITLLERFAPDDDLARAYAASAVLVAVTDPERAAAHRTKALELADRSHDAAARVETITWVSTAELVSTGAPARTTVERLWRDASAAGSDPALLAAWFKRAQYHYRNRELDALATVVEQGMKFARDRDLDRYIRTVMLERHGADLLASRGDWQAAEAAYEALAARPGIPWWMEMTFCRTQIALIRAREGRAYDRPAIEEALERERRGLLATFSERHPLHRACLEIAWLEGDVGRARASAAIVADIATLWANPWALGEVVFWQQVLGLPIAPHTTLAEPYARQIAGDARGAAAAWKRLGYPYEEALALTLGTADDQRDAIRALEALGARAAAERVRERLREAGVNAIPRGPQERHRAHPLGLTTREQEMLALLARGLSNAEIAQQVHRSVRTIENHVAALIEKLGARNRHDAVGIARERGFLS